VATIVYFISQQLYETIKYSEERFVRHMGDLIEVSIVEGESKKEEQRPGTIQVTIRSDSYNLEFLGFGWLTADRYNIVLVKP
jgi:hypothetical protein